MTAIWYLKQNQLTQNNFSFTIENLYESEQKFVNAAEGSNFVNPIIVHTLQCLGAELSYGRYYENNINPTIQADGFQICSSPPVYPEIMKIDVICI